jgi:tripartite-type tricarboxylate transporter receptor subunit TctC
VLGGHVQVYVGNQGDTQPTVKEGLFRYLAFADTKRSPQFKDVPTMTELGYPLVGASARGIAGPKGMPREVVAVLEAAIKKATEDPDHVEKMEKMGLPIRFLNGKEYTDFLSADYKRMEELLPIAMKDR